jgi:putative intracellular protease/amidase
MTRLPADRPPLLDENRPVAQLCHAPLALAAAGVLRGRRTAAYPALEPDVRAPVQSSSTQRQSWMG